MLDMFETKPAESKNPPHSGPMSESKIENDKVKPEIANLAKLASQASTEESATGFMQPGTKVKNKPGRPKGSTGKKEPKTGAPASGPAQAPTSGSTQNQTPGVLASPIPVIPTRKIVEPLVKLTSKLGVGIADDPRAAMTSDEINDISEALALVADKWMPGIMASYGPEAALMIAVGSWSTKVYALKQLKIEEKKKEQKMRAEAFKADSPQRSVVTDFEVPQDEPKERPGFFAVPTDEEIRKMS